MTKGELSYSECFFKKDWIKPYECIPVGAIFHESTYDNVTIEYAEFRGGVYVIDIKRNGISPNSNPQDLTDIEKK